MARRCEDAIPAEWLKALASDLGCGLGDHSQTHSADEHVAISIVENEWSVWRRKSGSAIGVRREERGGREENITREQSPNLFRPRPKAVNFSWLTVDSSFILLHIFGDYTIVSSTLSPPTLPSPYCRIISRPLAAARSSPPSLSSCLWILTSILNSTLSISYFS